MRGSMTDRPVSMQTRRILAVRSAAAAISSWRRPRCASCSTLPGAAIDLWSQRRRTARAARVRPALVRFWSRRGASRVVARAAPARARDRGQLRPRLRVRDASPLRADARRRGCRAVRPARRVPREHFADRCLDLVEHSLPAPLHRPWARFRWTDARGRSHRLPRAARTRRHAPRWSGSTSRSRDRRGRFARARDIRHRRWPLAQAAELARLLQRRGPDVRCVVDAIPEDVPLLARSSQAAGDSVTLLPGRPTSSATRRAGAFGRAGHAEHGTDALRRRGRHEGGRAVLGLAGLGARPFAPAERVAIVRAEDMPDGARGLAAIPPRPCSKALPLLP